MSDLLVCLKTLLLLWLGFAGSSCTKKSLEIKPNIILINIDDLGWQDLGYMGSTFYLTPNIDQLSTQGMVFTNGYSTAANCAPSRACLMTGKWSARHGIYTVGSSERGKAKDRKLIPVENTTTLDTSLTIIPQVLKRHGYTTCHAGKWHLSDRPESYGFDKNIGGGHNGHPRSYYPPYGNVDLEPEKDAYLTDLIMDHTIKFVKSVQEPFFLNYAPYAVHTPIQPVDSLKHKYATRSSLTGQSNVDYATMIENLDRNIGILLHTLEENQILENTFIVLTSDNGGIYSISSQRPLRAGKGSYYEGGIRVPFLFVWEGKIQAGTTSDSPITNLDIFPTILNLLNLEDELTGLDGQSILPLLEEKNELASRPLYWHFPIYLEAYRKNHHENRDTLFRTRPGSVIRDGNWKLHHYFEDNGIELYNLDTDIEERYNLATQFPKKADSLYTQLDQWRQKINAPVPTNLNPDYLE
jgi:arylsulfatase A-like enzyme